jgi:hypothetical protein
MNKIIYYEIGGLSICIDIDSDLNKKIFFDDYDLNFISNDIKNCNVFIKLTQLLINDDQPSCLNKIFTHGRMVFYSFLNEYIQMFYETEKMVGKIWNLIVNNDFSRFFYYICENSKEKIYPCKLASSVFLLQHSFINCKGLIVHAAGGSIQGKGLLFAAPSGTGKSTLSRLLSSSSRNHFFSEDRLIIRPLNDVWRVWGTPWRGSGNIARNESELLAALVFLRQSHETKVSPLSAADGLRRLLQVVSIPWHSPEWTNKGLAVCESLIQVIPMFELAFRPDQTAVHAVEQLLAALP